MKKPNGIKHIWVKLLFVYIALVTGNSFLVWLINYFGADITLGFFTISLLTIFFVAVHLIITTRIKRLTKVVDDIAGGDYSARVSEKGNDEISKLAGSINGMTAELNANLQLSKDFTRYFSHEFKTPLAVIRSYAEAAQMSKRPEKTAEYLETIISETDKLAEMSRTALELCKLDSTTIVKKEDVVRPASQICSIVLAMQFEWGAKNIEVVPELEEFEITSNGEMLSHIWQNLISNAIKYTGENGKIDIKLRADDGDLIFTVTDSGIGIAEEDIPHIFTPFFTGDKSESGRDNGLGLPLTKMLTEKLGGNVKCESEPGKGSTFTVTLPM